MSADDSNFFVPLDVATSQIRSDGKGYYGVMHMFLYTNFFESFKKRNYV